VYDGNVKYSQNSKTILKIKRLLVASIQREMEKG
jgi:hypothetical protein